MNAGTIWIEMAANLARLQQDMNQAKGIVSGAAKDIDRTISQVKTAFGALTAGVTFHVLQERFNQITESMAKLQDATEKVGSTVERMSQLQFFAGISGSSLEGLTSGLAKLSKGMVQSGNDTADTTQALKFLQLTAKDAEGNLKDPAELFQEIAKSLYDYKDGAGKAAIAQALLGKSGAEQLPMMKKMIELGMVEASVTAEQARAAEDYQVRIALLNRQKEMMWNAIVGKMLPSMESFVKVMLEASKKTDSMQEAGKRLASDGSIEAWADNASMSIAFLIDAMKTIVPVVELVGAGLTSLIARQDVALRINPLSSMGLWAMGQKPIEGYKDAVETAKLAQEEFSRKLEGFLNRDVEGTRKAMAAMIASRKANREDAARDAEGSSRPGGADKKDLNFSVVDAKQAAAELKLYETTMQGLEKELFQLNGAGKLMLLQYETEIGTLKKLTPEHKAALIVKAREIDLRQKVIDIMAAGNKALEAEQVLLIKRNEIITQQLVDYAKTNEDMEFELGLIGRSAREIEALNAVRRIELDLRQRIASLPKLEEGASPEQFAENARAESMLRERAALQKRVVLDGIAVRQQAERDWVSGAQQAFNEYIDHATNAAEISKNAFTNGFRALEDSLFQYIRHGKLGITDFVGMIKDQLARLAAQQFTLNITGSVAGTLGMSTAASAAGGQLGNLGLSGASNLLGGSIFGSSSAYGAMVPGLTMGGEQAAMLAAQTGAFGAEGLAATAAAGGSAFAGGISAGLAAIPGWGWAALAAMAVLSMSGESVPKASEAFLRKRSNGDFGVEMNNVAGGDPDISLVMALNAALNDKSKFDPAKLEQLVGTGVGTGSPADTAALINLLSQAMGPAAESAKALTKAVEEQAKADDQARIAAEALAAERRGLEIRLLEATGNTLGALAARRQLEMEATNDLNRELLRQIYAAEDLAEATAAAAKAQEEAVRVQEEVTRAQEAAAQAQARLEEQGRSAVLDAVGVLREAYQREAATLEEMASKWHSAAGGLRAYGASLVGVGTAGISYALASRQFSEVARRAQLGDLDAIGSLQGVSEQFRTASLSHAGSSIDYQRDLARIRNTVFDAAGLADRQELVALEQRDQIRTQTEKLIDIDGNLVTLNDAIKVLLLKVADLTKVTKDQADDTAETKEVILAVANGQLSFSTTAG